MKIKRFILLIVSLLAAFSVVSFAKEDDISAYIFDEAEFREIVQGEADPLLEEKNLTLSDDDAENAYMLHYVRSEEFHDVLANNEDPFGIISYEHAWKFIKDGKTLSYWKGESGHWSLTYVSEPIDSTQISEIDQKMVFQVIDEKVRQEGALIRPVIYFEAGRYAFTSFALFETGKGRWLIPCTSGANELGLKIGQAYSPADLLELLDRNYPLPDIDDIDPAATWGGSAYMQEPVFSDYMTNHEIDFRPQKRLGNNVIYLISGVAFVILTAAVVVIIRTHRIVKKG